MTRWHPSLSRNDDSNKETEGQAEGWGCSRCVTAPSQGRALSLASADLGWALALLCDLGQGTPVLTVIARTGTVTTALFFLWCLDFKCKWQREKTPHLKQNLSIINLQWLCSTVILWLFHEGPKKGYAGVEESAVLKENEYFLENKS